MCHCGCDPCYACGVRPTQLILGGGSAPYCAEFGATYTVPTYGTQSTSGSDVDQGFAYDEANRCYAWWKRVTTNTLTVGGITYNINVLYDTMHGTTRVIFGSTAAYITLTVGGTIPPLLGPEYPAPIGGTHSNSDRYAGSANSRNVFAVVAIQYSLIWHDTVVPEWNRADSKVRLEVYQGVLSAPCRGFSGTLSLSAQQQSPVEHNKGLAWLYIPTDATELAPCLASSSNGRSVSADF